MPSWDEHAAALSRREMLRRATFVTLGGALLVNGCGGGNDGRTESVRGGVPDVTPTPQTEAPPPPSAPVVSDPINDTGSGGTNGGLMPGCYAKPYGDSRNSCRGGAPPSAPRGEIAWQMHVGSAFTLSCVGPDSVSYGTDFDSGTGTSTAHAIHPNGTVRWKVSLPQTAGTYSQTGGRVSLSANGTLYLTGTEFGPDSSVRGWLTALNAVDGSVRFTVTLPMQSHHHGVAIGPDGTLYLGGSKTRDGYGGIVAALDGMTGKVKWTNFYENNGASRTPALSPDSLTVYQPLSSGHLVALDAETGQERWHFVAELNDNGLPSTFEASACIGPGGEVWVGGRALTARPNEGTLFALDGATGALRWRAAFPGGFKGAVGVSGDGQTLFAGCQGFAPAGGLYAVDAATGSVRWSDPNFGHVELVLGGGETVCAVGRLDSQEYALRAYEPQSGELLWTVAPEGAVHNAVVPAPNGLLYLRAYIGTGITVIGIR